MRILSLCLFLTSLVACTNQVGGSMNAPGPAAASISYARTTDNLPNSGVNVQAINTAIAANRGSYWAPEDEVLQESMSDPY